MKRKTFFCKFSIRSLREKKAENKRFFFNKKKQKSSNAQLFFFVFEIDKNANVRHVTRLVRITSRSRLVFSLFSCHLRCLCVSNVITLRFKVEHVSKSILSKMFGHRIGSRTCDRSFEENFTGKRRR